MDQPQQQAGARPLWAPPVAGFVTLAALFLLAVAVRRSPIADSARGVMIVVSAVASFVIALYGVKMVVEARVRGLASAVAGLAMIAMGIYTALHVLR